MEKPNQKANFPDTVGEEVNASAENGGVVVVPIVVEPVVVPVPPVAVPVEITDPEVTTTVTFRTQNRLWHHPLRPVTLGIVSYSASQCASFGYRIYFTFWTMSAHSGPSAWPRPFWGTIHPDSAEYKISHTLIRLLPCSLYKNFPHPPRRMGNVSD